MNRRNPYLKAIRDILIFFVHLIKLTILQIPRIIDSLFKEVSKRLRFSITFKATVSYAASLSAMLFLLVIALTGAFAYYLIYNSGNVLRDHSKVISEYLSEGISSSEYRMKNYADIQGIDISLFNKQKEVTFTTNGDISSVYFIGTERLLKDISFDRRGYMYLNIETGLNDDIYYITIMKPLREEQGYLVLFAIVLSSSFLFVIFLTTIKGSRTIRKMLRPIDNMIYTAKSISSNALSTRLNVVESHDELKDLAETFNNMLDRIQASYEQQNQFVSDASHELRTPISVIQGYANMLKRWGKDEKDVLEESIEAIKNESDNMKELVERLLFLARADKDTQKIEKSLFSTKELIDELIKETKLIDSEHHIISESNEEMSISADRSLIKQALRIFIDNSIKFTPQGGTIKINSSLKARNMFIIVEDNGVGIPKEDLPYIFNRFYKCDKSRTRNAGGTGLGLSIAKWIIEKHGGSVIAESIFSKGTRICVSLPINLCS